MRNTHSLLTLILLLVLSLFPSFSLNALCASRKAPLVARIDPTDWRVGLRTPQLQLMVYGQGIREADVSVGRTDVRLDSVVRLDSPNYLLLYLDLTGAQAGTLPLTFRLGRRYQTVGYQLLERECDGDSRKGFTNADVLYMLMPDRFAQGPGHRSQLPGMQHYVENRAEPSLRHGGDLEGIRRHLDYFCDLGVTALWLTPVLENDSPDDHGFSTYHGYATTDYYRIDPRFGTNADYRALIDAAHAKGLKVVMDMIFNHCGFEHPWVADLPSADWLNAPEWLGEGRRDQNGEVHTNEAFLQTSYKLTPVLDPYAADVDLRQTVDGWFVPTMPDLNHRNPHVMTYLIQNSIWWIETSGIDGIRMDTYPYADAAGMARWMQTLQREYPHFNVVGETWVTEPAYTAAWQKGFRQANADSRRIGDTFLPTVMDFSFFDRLSQAKHEETDGWWQGYNRLYNSFVYDYLYPDPTHVMAFVDNHDTDRFLGDGHDVAALRQALALLLTVRRIPQLYYGTEILMAGTKAVTDGHVRQDFPGGFPGDAHDAFTAEGRTAEQQAMYTWLSRLLHWRRASATVIEGTMTQFTPVDGVYVVARRHMGDLVMTVLNGTSSPATLRVGHYAELFAGRTSRRATDIPTGRTFDLTADLRLPAREALVLQFE